MSDSTNEHRLPPPAFPPGQRRRVYRNSTAPHAPAAEEAASDGIISPDEPIPHRRDAIERAFILPDEPIPERRLEPAPDFAEYVDPVAGEGEGEVVGMDLDASAEPIEVLTATDPHVAEVVEAVGNLAEALHRKGEAGLRASPAMSRFEVTLRAYCVGYVVGRRAEESPPPVEPPEDY